MRLAQSWFLYMTPIVLLAALGCAGMQHVPDSGEIPPVVDADEAEALMELEAFDPLDNVDVRTYVEVLPAPSLDDSRIAVEAPQLVVNDQPVVFDCTAFSGREMLDAVVRFEVHGVERELLFAAQVDVDLLNTPAPCRFIWEHEAVEPGLYQASISLLHVPDGLLAQREIVLRKLSREATAEGVAAAREATARLQVRLDELVEGGARLPYARTRLHAAQAYLPHLAEAYVEGDWRRAHGHALYIRQIAQEASASLDEAMVETAEPLLDPLPLERVEPRQGGLFVGEAPVFLLGASAEAADPGLPEALARHELDLVVTQASPADTLAGPERTAPLSPSLEALLASAAENNVSVVVDAGPEEMPAWAHAQWPDLRDPNFSPGEVDYVFDPGRELYLRHLRALAPQLAERDIVAALCLLENPRFRFEGERIREAFIDQLQVQYDDLPEMNRIWKARLKNFSQVRIPGGGPAEDMLGAYHPMYLESRAYRYDWQRFQHAVENRFLEAVVDFVRTAAPGLPAFVSGGPDIFAPGEAAWGVDVEALALRTPISGAAAVSGPADGPIAVTHPLPAAYYELLRSLEPTDPIIDTSFALYVSSHPYESLHFERTRAILWNAFVHGADAMALRLEPPTTDLAASAPFDHPAVLDAASRTALDLRRLAPVVEAIQSAPADVAVLWSMPSKIYDGGARYLDTLLEAYEAATYFGRNVRFISERQIVVEGLDDVRVLMIPDMLSMSDAAFDIVLRYIEDGGYAVRRGGPIPYDEHGRSRTGVLPSTGRTILVRGSIRTSDYLNALDQAAGLGAFPPLPRPVNEYGYPLEGVVARGGPFEDGYCLYVVNLREEPVQAVLANGPDTALDLIHEQTVTFPAVLEPLRPMILRLPEPPGPDVVMVAEPEGVPTAVIEPVLPAPEEGR